MAALAYVTTVLTVVVLAFYTWNPKARNYGGSTQGLRWLLWMVPLWLLLLPGGVQSGEARTWVRRLALLALASRCCRLATRSAIPGAIPGSWTRSNTWICTP